MWAQFYLYYVWLFTHIRFIYYPHQTLGLIVHAYMVVDHWNFARSIHTNTTHVKSPGMMLKKNQASCQKFGLDGESLSLMSKYQAPCRKPGPQVKSLGPNPRGGAFNLATLPNRFLQVDFFILFFKWFHQKLRICKRFLTKKILVFSNILLQNSIW